MAVLRFDFSKMTQEVQAMRNLAIPEFINRDAERIFDSYTNQLEGLSNSTKQDSINWEIREGDPIVTSVGNSEEVNRRGIPIYAKISSKWHIRRIAERKGPAKHFELVEQGSTHIKLLNRENELLRNWHVDIKTNDNAPGCPFHIQIRQDNEDNLPIPRFLSTLVTPLECVDFVLGELFHSSWARHQHDKSEKTRSLVAAQGKRTANLLEAQKREIENGPLAQTSWIKLKSWTPHRDVCLPS